MVKWVYSLVSWRLRKKSTGADEEERGVGLPGACDGPVKTRCDGL